MILVLVVIVALILWSIFFRLETTSSKDYVVPMMIFGIIGWILFVVVLGWIIGSYSTYVNMRADYDIILKQYRESIELYEDKAVLRISDSALTDFKYEGYQENIAELIKDLRYRVTYYNEDYISKKVVARSPFFNWIIIEPDADMHLIELRE